MLEWRISTLLLFVSPPPSRIVCDTHSDQYSTRMSTIGAESVMHFDAPAPATLLLVSVDRHALREQLKHIPLTAPWRMKSVLDGGAALQHFASTSPSLVLASSQLPAPGPDGFELCQRLRTLWPAAGFVLWLDDARIDQRLRAFDVRADDCLDASFDRRELIARANAVARRCQFSEPFSVPRANAARTSSNLSMAAAESPSADAARVARFARDYRLSPRETEILSLLIAGIEPKAMSAHVCCAHSSVRTHLRRLAGKLGCHTTREILLRFFDGR